MIRLVMVLLVLTGCGARQHPEPWPVTEPPMWTIAGAVSRAAVYRSL
jgi:hypothetical protein